MLCPVLLVVLLLAGAVQSWMVIVLSLVIGVTDALSMPSFQSIVPSIVEHDQITAGLALNSTQFNLSRILGPAIAGVLMASVGAAACFAVSAASYLPFIAVALWILPRGQAAPDPGDGTGPRGDAGGLRDIVGDPRLRGALLSVLATSVLCGPLIVFCPVLVRDVLQGDVAHFSAALGAFGVGGLLGAIGLLSIDPKRDLRRLGSTFAAGYGVVVILAALNPWYWGLPVLLVLAGISMNVGNTSANSVLQSAAAASVRGRTVSLFMLAMRGGLAVGSLLTGVSVTVFGVRHALLANGVLALAAHLMIRRKWLGAK
jgi:predicted MFS family arabinose efflux permease